MSGVLVEDISTGHHWMSKRGNSQVHHLERSRAEGPVLFLLCNQTMARASTVPFLGMSATFINMDLVSSLAAFTSHTVECFGQWKAHHYSAYAEISNTKMKESINRKKKSITGSKSNHNNYLNA